jgi:TctA family transporter
VFEAGYDALLLILDPARLGWLTLGAVVGLCVGILPGLGGTVGMAILLPFIFGMDPFSGIAMLMGMAAVVHTGDTFPSVLLGVPGSSGSQATIMDGYPMAQRGQAARALGAAFFVSMVGGIIGAATLFLIIGVARPVILALGTPELFMFAVLGLSMVGVLARGAPGAGVLSGLLGVMIGLIGLAPQVGQYR